MISNAKKAVIHVAKSTLRLHDEEYRALLVAEGGVSSSADLDDAGFDRLMKRFEKLGFVSTGKQRRRAKRQHQPAGLITPEQQGLIKQLYAQIGWTDLARQMGFSKRCCRKAFPQTRGEANKVIEGLKAMIARGARSQATAAQQ